MRKLLSITFIAATAITAAAKNQPYITRVLEYCPAPGQFINTLPVARIVKSKEMSPN